MKITVLMENTPNRDGFFFEHGLSLDIQTAKNHVLFDMGQSGKFAENARSLGIDLSTVESAVISHGHYDHGGGLQTFLSLNHKAPVYVSRYAFEPFYNRNGAFIGLNEVFAASSQVVLTEDQQSINSEMELLSCNGLPSLFPDSFGGLWVRRDGKNVPDDFRHEQYLVIREGGRKIVISGCSHKGVLNIVHWLQPDIFIGGFHYMKLDLTQAGTPGADAFVLDNAAQTLLIGHTRYYTCHCTGVPQYQYLKQRMGDRLNYLSSGETLVL